MHPESFEELAMPLFDQLYNFAHWLTGNREDAEDLVQETYAKALKGFRAFEAGTNLRAWMYRILRNAFLTSRSGLAQRKTSWLEDEEAGAAEWLTAHEITPEALLLRRESQEAAQEAVMEALAAMPVAYREVLLLCEMEEMPYREIAGVLGVPVGTVMSRLSRARKLLSGMLAKVETRAAEGGV
jgi:RNA polymerase sigma-70 factor (ECF subfamily)